MIMRLATLSFLACLSLLLVVPWQASAAPQVTMYASPTSGAAPLVVTFSAANSAGCQSGSYKLEYGDGKTDTILVPTYACQNAFTIQHTYSANKSYTATLSAGDVVFDTEVINVGVSGSTGSKLIQDFIFSASAPSSDTSLDAKFRVHFVGDAMCDGASYSIDYGDGNSAPIPDSAYSSLCYQTDLNTLKEVTGSFASHTYSSNNTYEAKLKRGDQALETLSVKVGSAIETNIAASPASGESPLSVNFTGSVKCSDLVSASDTLRLSFGDGGSEAIVGTLCNGSAVLQHSYLSPGTYTATLIDNSGGGGASPVLDSVIVTVRPKGDQNEDDTTVATCPALTKQLQKGDADASTGGEVSKLQQFLTDYFQLDGSLVVGTFGPLTESYVKQFQTFNGLSPVGWVGPQTRAAILAACDPIYTLTATPPGGAAPLQVNLSYNDPAQGQTYNIDFGDGTTGKLVYTVGTNCTTNCSPRYDTFHTYAKDGRYTAKVTHVVDPCAGKTGCTDPLQVTEVGSAIVAVGNNAGSGSCVILTYNLYLDVTDAMTNGDVTKLQNFLIAGGYMQGSATGYFGPMTENAVKAYQAAKGIVSSGTPETTGYGYVGSKTRAAMATGCGGSSGAIFSASVTTGAAPLTTIFTSRVPNNNYMIDFGDGTQSWIGGGASAAGAPACVLDDTSTCTRTTGHVYQGGTYTAKLLKQSTTVTCTDITYDPNNPLSFLGIGTSPSCTNSGSATTVVAQITFTVSGGGGGGGGGDLSACTLGSGQSMRPGQSIKSCNGRFQLSFQSDGNVVLYEGSTALWSTQTNTMTAEIFTMQPDGNLVLYARAPYSNQNAIWASGSVPPTGKRGGGSYGAPAKLVVQNDGNLVVYRLSDNHVYWSSGTAR
ncbi:hypothetical protein C4568_01810 [Candidatus Parcubacteria bacterium]|nr:MAG: hypothetical protein C4568_01810 [Candidatus Parcubacteria bacterium]